MAKTRKPRAAIIRFLKAIAASPEQVAGRFDCKGYAVNGQWFREAVGDDAFCMGLITFNPARRCERVLTEAGQGWITT